ncbi:MAG TPA: hypothetical protein VFN77_03640 [Acetobacteraceae bacterium]|nr:hypothetical protein [Acetobacteraceae bacterium]
MSRMKLPERAIVIAMDHARTLGAVPGLDDPGVVLDRVLVAGADGIMTSCGVVKRYTEGNLLHNVEDARRRGVGGARCRSLLAGHGEGPAAAY